MATIKEIAKLANVSIATVSNVLNQKPGSASPEKVEKVLKVAKSLNYRPNYLAQSLKRQRSRSIGIIAEDLTVSQTAEIINGIEEYCEEYDYEALLANMRLFKRYGNNLSAIPERSVLFNRAFDNLVSKQVEGCIYIGYHGREVSFSPPDTGLPFVYTYCVPKDKSYPYVLSDDENASLEIGRALISMGHRRIGIISGPVNSFNSQKRLVGIQQALFEASIPYNVGTTVIGDWTRECGYHAASQLLSQGVTAIYAFSDKMISGVYTYCIEHRISVGKDISLFGFDDSDIVHAYTPPLASAKPDLQEMGHKAAELVLSQLQGKTVCTKCHVLPCTIHVRPSVCSIGEA